MIKTYQLFEVIQIFFPQSMIADIMWEEWLYLIGLLAVDKNVRYLEGV